jgi:hypothetical protein
LPPITQWARMTGSPPPDIRNRGEGRGFSLQS